MKTPSYPIRLLSAVVGAGALLAALPLPAAPPVKVFILAGQSNMVGAGRVEADPNRNGGKGSLGYLAEHDPKYKPLKDKGGKWVERDDVSIWFLGRKGKLAPGFGSNGGTLGPELGFGQVVGDALDEPVLLIKTAWGGKSLQKDFRPPSSGGQVGPFYTEMFTHVKSVLDGLKTEFPQYRAGYEIAGFGWHQGWNDGCDQAACQEYEENLANFIRDVRKELGIEKLPFVIADSGFGGKAETNARRLMIRSAQAAPAKKSEFKGNVACVPPESFFRTPEESPSNQGYHWNGNAGTYCLIGESMGKAMLELMGTATPKPAAPAPAHLFRNTDGSKTFKAQLQGYDPKTNRVTVRRENGNVSSFDLKLLHPDDQEFVTSSGKDGQ
ncbi:MAG: sialate O-acetylesterase [Akkermansiaceae bacterium]|nr:sialate O-acetylesterase [Akkermansiaceae bacterium]